MGLFRNFNRVLACMGSETLRCPLEKTTMSTDVDLHVYCTCRCDYTCTVTYSGMCNELIGGTKVEQPPDSTYCETTICFKHFRVPIKAQLEVPYQVLRKGYLLKTTTTSS